jgi:iodotyrosine deiodinase
MLEKKGIPLSGYEELSVEIMKQRSSALLARMSTRRSVRDFSSRPVPREVIEDCVRTAGTAPSGANRQPWHFVIVTDPALKRRIREGAEREERAFYERRASEAWLDALAPLGTDAEKPFLEKAPCLICVFMQLSGVGENGLRTKHYYTWESTGIATGMLITAVHNAGLVMLPYTPSPMKFLNAILERPDHERPFLVLVVGYPAANARVPAIGKKAMEEIATFL